MNVGRMGWGGVGGAGGWSQEQWGRGGHEVKRDLKRIGDGHED